jgi:hypothetical protein
MKEILLFLFSLQFVMISIAEQNIFTFVTGENGVIKNYFNI